MQKPTRQHNLLDLVLTDIGSCVSCRVLPMIEDHAQVLIIISCAVSVQMEVLWECSKYGEANWKDLKQAFKNTDWNFLDYAADTDAMQEILTEHVLSTARLIPTERRRLKKPMHPWMNQRCLELVGTKRRAEGTAEYAEKVRECSAGVLEEYLKYVERVCDELRKLPRSSKKWWKLAKGVALRSSQNSSIPPLKHKGEWVTSAEGKCKAFLEILTEKYQLPPEQVNEYTALKAFGCDEVSSFLPVRARVAKRF